MAGSVPIARRRGAAIGRVVPPTRGMLRARSDGMSLSRWSALGGVAIAFALTTTGCWGQTCIRAIRCVERCGGPIVQSGCNACPGGTFDDLMCTDAAARDAEVASDGGSPADAFSSDTPMPSDAGATSDAPTGLPFHLVRHDCGPTDGPALHVGLYASVDPACGGDTTQRSLEIFVYPSGTASFPPAAGTTIVSTAAAPSGTITECPGGSPPCRVSSDFSVTFDTFADDVSATGRYAVTFGDGETTTGTFDATWCEREPILCG